MATPDKKLPLCNEKCLQHTITATGESAKLINLVLDFQSSFIADKIIAGGFEAVRIAHFGNFRPKMKMLMAKGYGERPKITVRRYGKLMGKTDEDETI